MLSELTRDYQKLDPTGVLALGDFVSARPWSEVWTAAVGSKASDFFVGGELKDKAGKFLGRARASLGDDDGTRIGNNLPPPPKAAPVGRGWGRP